jgi:acetylornithine deacetylase
VDRVDVNPSSLNALEAFNRTSADYRGRPCIVGRLRGSGGGRSLLLNAHVDTVPIDPAAPWTYPPYSGDIAGGRLYGRGACDDKAGIIECLLVAEALTRAGATLAGDLMIASVIDDETSGNGSLACVEQGYTADGVIIVDGTWPERFIVSHMGQVTFRVRLPGVAGHATSAGPNPIHAIGPVVEALGAVATGTERMFVNFGSVHGGVFPGSVPGDCVLHGQCGFPSPWTVAAVKDALTKALARVGPAGIEFAGLETPPEIGDPGNAMVRVLTDVVARRQGAQLKESVIAGHCDLRHYTKARRGATRAACLYGPGGGRNVHGADEYFELAHLPLVAGNLACVALQWCNQPREQ